MLIPNQHSHLSKKIRHYFQDKPIEKAWLFGSYARQEADKQSDVDILVQWIQPNSLDLLDYIGFQQDLENILGTKVDLVEIGYLMPFAIESVEKEKILIYERKTKKPRKARTHLTSHQ